MCTVTNGSGTVGTANITNVTVVCAASTGYTVSGTVTGLTGSGLVLQNNGGDDLLVTAAGVFAFSTSLAAGVPCVVTVSAQPSAPPQKCVVTNGSGTVGAANVTGVTVPATPRRDTPLAARSRGSRARDWYWTFTIAPPTPWRLLPVSKAGAFIFPKVFAQGAAYSSSAVGAQPNSPTQLCIVNNAGGLIGTANVTDVAVVCSTPGRFAYAANAGDNTIILILHRSGDWRPHRYRNDLWLRARRPTP